MKRETLEQAKNLEYIIDSHNKLLTSKGLIDGNYLVKVTCANSSDYPTVAARIPRDTWLKMLNAVEEERDKYIKELEDL